MSIVRYESGPRMSQAVSYNGIVYLAGQVAEGATVKEQTTAVLAEIDRLLASQNSSKSRILSAIASKITQDIFGSKSVEGTFSIDNLLLDYQVVGDKVVINLTDGITNTTIEVPRFEVDKAAGS